MRFDVTMMPERIGDATDIARAVEAYGFAGLWTTEIAHNPFLPLTLAAEATERIQLGTAIALAFPRSPMVTAQIAWDLAAQSNGRFILGLGTQVRQHIVGRFSTPWAAPVPRLREYIEALRAIWANFQTHRPLRYGGRHYRFTLMTPFFSPGPIAAPNIPIYIAGVSPGLCRLAGATCQGFHVHPFHTARYLRESIIPAIESGAQSAGRARADLELSSAVFVVTQPDEAEAVKQQIAFYASTANYRPVMDLHGWGDLHLRLNQLAREGKWREMGPLIPDDMLRAFAVVAPADELASAVRARYDGLLDRVGYYFAFQPGDADRQTIWRSAADVFG
jgi:probable F420-dependent oxidoreductase